LEIAIDDPNLWPTGRFEIVGVIGVCTVRR
jgi:hypothetical protein